jgi:hypothetical protein
MIRRLHSKELALACLLILTFFVPSLLSAQEAKPAATLLLPYFSVDLADGAGAASLFAVANASDELVIARATLWTDWAAPTLSFDLAIPAKGAVPINLRDIFAGVLPAGDLGGESVPGCADPLSNPQVSGALRDRILAQHTGAPSPVDGLCYGSQEGGGTTALGFVTIDVIDRCAQDIRNPLDEGYFGEGGVASDRNVIYGDLFALNPGQDFAQGFDLVHLVADAELYGEATDTPTFYHPFTSLREDVRSPVGAGWSARYLAGGAFDGGTDLVLWLSPRIFGEAVGWECGSTPFDGVERVGWMFVVHGQGSTYGTRWSLTPPAHAWKLTVGGDDLQVTQPFGVLEIFPLSINDLFSPPFGPWRGWAGATYSASGRFSVGINSIRIPDVRGDSD